MKPWGQIEWILGLSDSRQWDFVGCLGTEERSLAVYLLLADLDLLNEQILLRIERNSPHSELAKQRLAERAGTLQAANRRPHIIAMDLLTPINQVERAVIRPTNGSVILDITSLPKRFFFLLLKRYFLSDAVKNLIVTYSLPAEYAKTALSGDMDPWDALPTFRPPDPELERIANNRLIVNVGFMPQGLVTHIEGPDVEKQIDLIVPFPSPISAVQRAWQSVWSLTPGPQDRSGVNEHRVGANDLPEAFSRILHLLPSNSNLVSFAPFGPKPISAAMCLYSSLTSCPVYYAQPKTYHPDYSTGVARLNGKPQIFGYWIKHEGLKLYDLPSHRRNIVD